MVKERPKFPYRIWALRVEEPLLLKREKVGRSIYCGEIINGGFSFIGEDILMRSNKRNEQRQYCLGSKIKKLWTSLTAA